MPRAHLIRTKHLAYHVTSRSNNREWFYLPLDVCWEIFTRKLAKATEKYGLEIGLFVLMSNHFHLLLRTPNENIAQAMQYFISCTTKEVQRRTGRINHIFGGRYRWSVLESATAHGYVYKYVARNPVRAGLCANVEDYPMSTMNDWRCRVPIVEGIDAYWKSIPRDPEVRSRWLNSPLDTSEKLIGRGLRRYRFQFTTESNLQRELRSLRQGYGVETLDTFQY